MPDKTKNYNGELIIGEEIITLQTDRSFKSLVIYFYNNLFIENLLPTDYMIMKTKSVGSLGVLSITKLNNRSDVYGELFKYNGLCIIKDCLVTYEDNIKVPVSIKRPSSITWNQLKGHYTNDNNLVKQVWEDITTDYDQMKNTTRNDLVKRVRRFIEEDVENNTTSFKNEIIEQPSRIKKQDKGFDIVGNQHTSHNRHQIKSSKTPYVGKYHFNLKTGKTMTGTTFDRDSVELEPIGVRPEKIEIVGNVKPKTKKLKQRTARRRQIRTTGVY